METENNRTTIRVQRSQKMLKLVAEINGQKVFSDKRPTSIVNTRVTFSDGSWCDVATGQVVNQGKGAINIGSSGRIKKQLSNRKAVFCWWVFFYTSITTGRIIGRFSVLVNKNCPT